MNELSPYSAEELQRMRRLILACGQDVPAWADKLRRSADWLQSLSPGQAAIVAQQAAAIAADPDDCGPADLIDADRAEVEAIPEGDRPKYLSKQIIGIRRQHFPGLPDE